MKHDPQSATISPVLSIRSSGILIHISSLPGSWGIGDMGPEARRFVDILHYTGQQLWEVLPLGPTGYGDSPYQGLSAFAGNPNLISPEVLLDERLLSLEDLAGFQPFGEGNIDYGAVIPFKRQLLQKAYERFQAGGAVELIDALREFRGAQASWLEDYALFIALKEAHGGAEWTTWPKALVRREPAALELARKELAAQIDYHVFAQFIFFRQWLSLKSYANERGVRIVGDIPIFMGHDSADVWAHQDLFYMDKNGQLTVVAGAAPDFFIKEGQLWGNPLYRWDVLKKRGYDWWLERIRMALQQADILRLDHFRGFAHAWEVKAGSENAIKGRWAPGPGADLFAAIARKLGPLPLIAEDLGLITPDVHALRAQFGYPGMKVLQEAFHGDATNIYAPHNYTHDFVVYTGTHDMQTTAGWWQNLPPAIKHQAQLYMGTDGHDIVWDMIRLAFASVADMAIIPMQDLLGLDNSARLNTPGDPSGNWTWRYRYDQLDYSTIERLQAFTTIYGRSKPAVPATPPGTTLDSETSSSDQGNTT
ncbi:MAG: 4-alpha-glucanotransferase [Chloroflexia bacterium]